MMKTIFKALLFSFAIISKPAYSDLHLPGVQAKSVVHKTNQVQPLFTEHFNDKHIEVPGTQENTVQKTFVRDRIARIFRRLTQKDSNNQKENDRLAIKDGSGKTVWTVEKAPGQIYNITRDGSLEMGGARYLQKSILEASAWDAVQDYSLEFTINIQTKGNEGHSGRPVAIIIPRAEDENFNKYYAVTYYLETKRMGLIVANLFYCKWAIINTAAPSGMDPLVEGFYMLRENVDYRAKLTIQNTKEGHVGLSFYIDGPTNAMKEYKPLLEYTDRSPHRIMSGIPGPAFGTAGYSDAVWGHSPLVKYSNINIFSIEDAAKRSADIKQNTSPEPKDIINMPDYDEMKYLVNRGIMNICDDGTFRPQDSLSTAEFTKMLRAVEEERYTGKPEYRTKHAAQPPMDVDMSSVIQTNEINWYTASYLIYKMHGSPQYSSHYAGLIQDSLPPDYKDAVHYAFQKGLSPHAMKASRGTETVTRREAATILMRLLDDNYRRIHYPLELPHILSAGAILQRDTKIPIWGRGFSGEEITVSFKNQKVTTTVANGHWHVELEPEPWGGPFTLSVTNGKTTIESDNIMLGEVFLVAGQSNAKMYLYECDNADKAKKNLIGRNIHFYFLEHHIAVSPRFSNPGGWSLSLPWALDWSSAIGTFFVQKLLELNNDLQEVPIGIVPLAYGGSTIELFMPQVILKEKNYVQPDNEPIMSGYWNGFMQAVAPFQFKGVIYYQGENSSHIGYPYERLLRDFIRGLRLSFQNPSLPFMLVQLAGYGENFIESDLDSWPVIREIQMRVAQDSENIGIVTAIDLSDEDPLEIHPTEKQTIGRRLAYLAMDMIYGEDYKHKVPIMKSFTSMGKRFIVQFDHLERDLFFVEGIGLGFEIRDKEGRWHAANAEIYDGRQVEIWHDSIPAPKGARYAWRNYPAISLYQNPDIPVLPFNTTVMGLNPNALPPTNEYILKIPRHGLIDHDAIVNDTRNNQFRMILREDHYRVRCIYNVEGQIAGDIIYLLSRGENRTAMEGTSETIILMPDHRLKKGDWIRNNSRKWEARRVKNIIDKDRLEVEKIDGQTEGDEIEVYNFVQQEAAL